MGETAEGKHALSIFSLLSQGPLPPVVLIIKLPGVPASSCWHAWSLLYCEGFLR